MMSVPDQSIYLRAKKREGRRGRYVKEKRKEKKETIVHECKNSKKKKTQRPFKHEDLTKKKKKRKKIRGMEGGRCISDMACRES